MARADMESAHGAPIGTSGTHEAAGRVIGVNPCGCDPVCHDGRSVSKQAQDGDDGSNNGSRLIHGGARVALLTQARATVDKSSLECGWRCSSEEPHAAMANAVRSSFRLARGLGSPKSAPSRRHA